MTRERRATARTSVRGVLLAGALVASIVLAGCTAFPRDGALRPGSREPAEAAAPAGGLAVAGTFAVGDVFRVLGTRVTVAPASAAGIGTPAAPVDLAAPHASARTALARDHWVLVVELAEAAPRRADGLYRARLDWNMEPRGAVVLRAAPAAQATGVTLAFDVGSALDPSSVYLLTVEPLADAREPVDVVLESTASGDLTFSDASGVNPTLRVPPSTPLRLTLRNADGLFHNVAVLDADGAVVGGPSPNVAAKGDVAVLAWDGASDGTFTYVCQYHASTMRGAIEIV